MYGGSNKGKKLQTKDASKYPQGYFKIKPCGICSEEFKPHAPSEKYCKDECAQLAAADRYLERNYDITLKEYNKMLDKQSHLCALCHKEGFVMKKSHKVKLVVDHCHTTGEVRGLLCHNCNRALGLLKDNTDTVKRVLEYLK